MSEWLLFNDNCKFPRVNNVEIKLHVNYCYNDEICFRSGHDFYGLNNLIVFGNKKIGNTLESVSVRPSGATCLFYLRTAASASYHYENPAKRVGIEQK
jgi:hypothetical protein